MNKLFLYQYINKLKKEDIIKYGMSQDIIINEDEVNLIYNYIKNDYNRIIDNPIIIINEIKDKVRSNVYEKILELYDKYKDMLDKLKEKM